MAVDCLLGRQIVGRPQHVFLEGDGKGSLRVVGELRQAHVEHFDDAPHIDQQIRGLDIAMHQARLMRVLQSGGGLGKVVGHRGIGERVIFLYHVLQIVPLDVLHHQVMRLFLVVDQEHSHDVRMVERGGGLRSR